MTSKEAPARDPKSQETVTKNKRADWKKEKELDEARKAGTAAPEVDEEGRDINPHIPQYIKGVPWYIGEDRPTLSHQRTQEEKQKHFDKLDKWYKKGVAKGKIATKFRKGACENCGAITHKKKDCLERPRKVGARFNGEDIRPDELLPGELNFDYDGKRDRWAGYDVSVHSRVVDEYAAVDEAKRQLKAAQLEEDLASGSASAAAILNDDGVEEKYAEEMDMPGTRLDADVRQTVRNLRIREDTAKYLHNLDSNSAHYDPKTRSMRDNPFANKGDKGAVVDYAGDNFVRSSGVVSKIAEQQLFAWDATERGADVHLHADPTKLELLHRTYAVKKDSYKNEVKDGILDKYGGAEHLEAPPRELLLAQTEEYVEYSRTGKVIRGQEKARIQSKYEEDVHPNNHESVWGSYWKDFQWGYACCHSVIKGSYCTGEAGKNAEKTETPMVQFNPAPASDGADNSKTETSNNEADSDTRQKTLVELHKEKLEQNKTGKSSAKSAVAAAAVEEAASAERLKRALAAEEEREREATKFMRLDERKRPYNSLQTDSREPTDEEMAAYRMKRTREDDPMAAMLK